MTDMWQTKKYQEVTKMSINWKMPVDIEELADSRRAEDIMNQALT